MPRRDEGATKIWRASELSVATSRTAAQKPSVTLREPVPRGASNPGVPPRRGVGQGATCRPDHWRRFIRRRRRGRPGLQGAALHEGSVPKAEVASGLQGFNGFHPIGRRRAATEDQDGRPAGRHPPGGFLQWDLPTFDAHATVGGRILSVDAHGSLADTALPALDRFDLGPSWFWPAVQPQLDRLVTELGLERFVQFEDGDLIVERAARQPLQRMRAMSTTRRRCGWLAARVRLWLRCAPGSGYLAGAVDAAGRGWRQIRMDNDRQGKEADQ